MTTIICKKCEVAQDSSEFYKNGRGYWTRECKTCKANRQVKWRADNREHAREAARIHQRKYYAANTEKCAEKRKKYYAAHAEKARQDRRAHYWANPEAAREAVKAAYRRNPARAREYAKQWRLKNLERANLNRRRWGINNPNKVKKLKQRDYEKRKTYIRAKNNAWEKANPEKAKLIRQGIKGRRRAQIQATQFEKFSLKEILDRGGYRCHICGKRVARKEVSFDHLIPLSKGGSHTKLNIGVAHLSCNKKRGAGRIAAQLRLV